MMNSDQNNHLKEGFAHIAQAYGDEYPILFLEPGINSEEHIQRKSLATKNNNSIIFLSPQEFLPFVNNLLTSFVLIFSSKEYEQQLVQNSHMLPFHRFRRMFDIEEEMLLKDVFKGISDQTRNPLEAYVFFMPKEIMTEAPPVDEDEDEDEDEEEEVMVMLNIKDMAQEFQQEYVVIWYDPHAGPENKEILTKKVDIEPNDIYTDFNKLCQRIYDPNNVPCHLIMTNKVEAEKIINEMDKLKDLLLCLYIYCDDPDLAKRKIRKGKVFIEKTMEALIPKVKQGIRSNSKLVNTFPAFATDFDASDRSDVYNLHYYLKGLINFENRKQAKEDFINLAQRIYDSKKLFDFKKGYHNYDKNEIFKWYSAQSPVHQLLNNCLRIASHDSILYCRYILRDLERAIKEEYQEKCHQYNGVVYRGAYISQGEWDKLQRNVGKEIEMYGFLSTSQDLKVAENFLFLDLQNKILISIVIPPLPNPELNEQGFADISQYSGFEETEILFNVRSKFQILEAGTVAINDQGKQCRHLVLMYGAPLLRKYMTKKEPSLSIELELPLDLKCNSCQTKSNLFTFHKEVVEVCCIECLATKSLPEDLPLLSLALPNPKKITKRLSGTILNWNENTGFPFYGYKCKDCLETGKKKYLTWRDLNNGEIKRQCFECFQKRKKIESHFLIFESNPYTFWTEHQAAWETIQSDYQPMLFHELSTGQSYVFQQVQRFDLSIEYEKKVIGKLNRKRNKELEKIASFSRLAEAYRQLRRSKEALDYLKKILKFYQETFGNRDQLVTLTLQELAFVYEGMEEFEKAEHYFTTVLKMRDKKDPSIAFSYNSLAGVYKTLGKPQKALEYHRKALEIYKAQDGEKHRNAAMSYHNIASVYEDMGDFQKALNDYQKALSILESIFGEKHPETISIYNNLGTVNRSLGKYQKALECHLKVVNYWISIYGEKHTYVATSYNNIGVVYNHLRENQKAEESYLKALDIMESISGEKDRQVAGTSYAGLGRIYQDLKQYNKAEEYLLKALEVIKSVFGEKHKKTALAYNNLGFLYRDLHGSQKAEELFLKALEITKSIYGENHPDTLPYYTNLAGIFQSSQNDETALEYHMKALAIGKFVHGESHTVIAAVYDNLGCCYQKQRKHEEAKDCFEKALDIRKSLLGEEHLETADSYARLGLAEIFLENRTEGVEYLKKSDRIKKSHSHQSITESEIGLASASNNLEQPKKILDSSEKALETRESSKHKSVEEKKQKTLEDALDDLNQIRALYGEKHPVTINAYGIVASLEPDKNKALAFLIKAYKIIESMHGKDHEITRNCYSRVESALKALQAEGFTS